MDAIDLRLRGEQPGSLQEDVRTKAEEYTKAKTLAVQFEAMLMTQMLREMKDSMAPESDDGGFGGEMLGDTVNMELGLALSNAGGMGLADSLLKSLTRLDEQPGQSEVEAAMAALPSTTSAPMTMPGGVGNAISSDFGWRQDPIHGQARFHAGLDLKVAYGQEVRAASGGVVKFAGEQSGYGTTVVVDHGDGLETRYAHLSSADVRAGAMVSAGQAIARSGNSGRSTGAHLHFEVRQNGQPIDPDRVTGFFPVADGPGVGRR
jgi:murein DD-endopeptidase MepM/ murein hydrolase activator NlpD